jgi:hypothetical protein
MTSPNTRHPAFIDVDWNTPEAKLGAEIAYELPAHLVRVSSTLSVPKGVSLKDAATRAANARKDELKRLAEPLGELGLKMLGDTRRLFSYMQNNFGTLTEPELVEALTNHLEVLCPNVLQSEANLFIGYARLALHSITQNEAAVFLLSAANLLQETAKTEGRVFGVERIWDALSENFATVH